MPAITVENPLALPRLPAPDPLTRVDRDVVVLNTAESATLGDHFVMRRPFAGLDLETLDPFVHMDQSGESHLPPGEPIGTAWHPHRGFETVTYVIDGRVRHQDSNGGGGLIGDGDTQWMTAGAGILHKEAPPEELVMKGGVSHAVQLWVNLPGSLKFAAPRYQDITAEKITLLGSYDGGALVRVIAGRVGGYSGPGITHTPITLVHATLAPGASLTLPWRRDFNALAYALAGRGTAGPRGRRFELGHLAVFGPGNSVTVAADTVQDERSRSLEVLFMGGLPIREPVAVYGPFVMNTQAELAQAFEDFRAGRLGSIPAVPVPVRRTTPDPAK
ncbi:pirin family protein [Planotetraspora sp. GP83]|uniref:pirin family protein n=1 Tax=Planotetraspora sp. GP83 TaxID=3156264 RepID=UPI003512F996